MSLNKPSQHQIAENVKPESSNNKNVRIGGTLEKRESAQCN